MRFLLLLLSIATCAESHATVTIITSSLPGGTAGTSYAATIEARGGCTPYLWNITGTPPPGVEFTSENNTQWLAISGTPTASASYSFTAQVKGCGGHISTVPYTVVIQPAPATAYSVNLSWIASTSTDVAGYNIYRGPDGVNWQLINTGPLPSTLYTDSAVSAGTTYYYAATAVDTSGNESAKSTPIQVVIP